MTLCLEGQEPLLLSLPIEKERMIYEADFFADTFLRKDISAVEQALVQTGTVMDILCRARMHSGIRFQADDQ